MYKIISDPMWNTFFQCDVHMFYGARMGDKKSRCSPRSSPSSPSRFLSSLWETLCGEAMQQYFFVPLQPLLYFLPPSGFLFECVMCVRVMLSKIQISWGLQCARTPNFIPAVPRWGIALDCLMSGTVNNAYHKRKSNDILSYLWTLFSVSLKHLNWYK